MVLGSRPTLPWERSGEGERERWFPGASPGLGFPVLYCSELKNLQGQRGRRRGLKTYVCTHTHIHTYTHMHTHTLRGAGAHTHSWRPHMICCISTLLSPASTPQGAFQSGSLPSQEGQTFSLNPGHHYSRLVDAPPEPCWAGSACPQPEHRASGEQGAGAGGSLLDDGGQLRAEVLAVEPLLKQDVCGVPYVVPARTKDRHPALHLGVAGERP